MAVCSETAVDVGGGAEAEDVAVSHVRFGVRGGADACPRGLEEVQVLRAGAGGVREEDVGAEEVGGVEVFGDGGAEVTWEGRLESWPVRWGQGSLWTYLYNCSSRNGK